MHAPVTITLFLLAVLTQAVPVVQRRTAEDVGVISLPRQYGDVEIVSPNPLLIPGAGPGDKKREEPQVLVAMPRDVFAALEARESGVYFFGDVAQEGDLTVENVQLPVETAPPSLESAAALIARESVVVVVGGGDPSSAGGSGGSDPVTVGGSGGGDPVTAAGAGAGGESITLVDRAIETAPPSLENAAALIARESLIAANVRGMEAVSVGEGGNSQPTSWPAGNGGDINTVPGGGGGGGGSESIMAAVRAVAMETAPPSLENAAALIARESLIAANVRGMEAVSVGEGGNSQPTSWPAGNGGDINTVPGGGGGGGGSESIMAAVRAVAMETAPPSLESAAALMARQSVVVVVGGGDPSSAGGSGGSDPVTAGGGGGGGEPVTVAGRAIAIETAPPRLENAAALLARQDVVVVGGGEAPVDGGGDVPSAPGSTGDGGLVLVGRAALLARQDVVVVGGGEAPVDGGGDVPSAPGSTGDGGLVLVGRAAAPQESGAFPSTSEDTSNIPVPEAPEAPSTGNPETTGPSVVVGRRELVSDDAVLDPNRNQQVEGTPAPSFAQLNTRQDNGNFQSPGSPESPPLFQLDARQEQGPSQSSGPLDSPLSQLDARQEQGTSQTPVDPSNPSPFFEARQEQVPSSSRPSSPPFYQLNARNEAARGPNRNQAIEKTAPSALNARQEQVPSQSPVDPSNPRPFFEARQEQGNGRVPITTSSSSPLNARHAQAQNEAIPNTAPASLPWIARRDQGSGVIPASAPPSSPLDAREDRQVQATPPSQLNSRYEEAMARFRAAARSSASAEAEMRSILTSSR